jgi:hypothetical protein
MLELRIKMQIQRFCRPDIYTLGMAAHAQG